MPRKTHFDVKAKTGLIRIVKAVNIKASHIEYAFYFNNREYAKVKPYLIKANGFKIEKKGKLVYRGRFCNIFVYNRKTYRQ